MSTPDTAPVPYTEGTVRASAVAGPQPAAAFALGGVLRDLVHRSGAYHSEGDQDAAIVAVNKWVSAQVSASDKRALAVGDEHAPKEDVSQRTPPGGAFVAVSNVPAIDYDRLAAALVRAGVQPSELRGISR